MSWIIIGDRNSAAFACDTEMKAFGPLHRNYRHGSAKEELEEFADTLDTDPRRLHEERLHMKYIKHFKHE